MAPVYSVFVHQPSVVNEPFFGVSPYLSRACPGRLAPPRGQGGLERSIRRVMHPYGAGNLYEAALLPSYRCLRRRRPQEDNQAVAVTQDDEAYKILLDVRNFPEHCLSVRAVGDSELVVEGKVETREESAPSDSCKTFKNASRNFQQRFVFPGIQIDGIVSRVSSDGVLTIVAPKRVSRSAMPMEMKRLSDVGASAEVARAKPPNQSTGVNHAEPTEIADRDRDVKESENQPDGSENGCDLSSNHATASAFEQESVLRKEGNDMVPLDIRGLFFKDSFFEDSRSQYEDAINNVIELIDKDLKVADPIDWYKVFRTDNDQEDTRAGTVTEKDDSYKVILDVRDFTPNSLSVSAVGESELLVEGNLEKKEDDVVTRRSFRKRFGLPGAVGVNTVTSALSKDGILTITAPKKKPEMVEDSFVVGSSSSASNQDSGVPSSDSSSTYQNAENGSIAPSETSSHITNDGPRLSNSNPSAKQEKERGNDSENKTDDDQEGSKFLLIGFAKDLTDSNLEETVKQRKKSGKANNNVEAETEKSQDSERPLKIISRGPFYQDSFFENARPNYQSAVEQILDRWVDVPSVFFEQNNPEDLRNFDRYHNALSNYRSLLGNDYFDDLTCYKTLRHRSPKEESQASTVSELEDEYKIVLDVHGFSAEEVSIRAISHNELVVEGKTEQRAPSGAVSFNTFSKQFFLPKPVMMNEISAALSKDDVLSISVPKNLVFRILL